MQPVRFLIADDEAIARTGLRRIVESVPHFVVIAEARNGHETVRSILRNKPDIVLLDIQMPDLDGFEVVSAVGDSDMPALVFVTAHDEHALRAFGARALDYVLKPVDPDRLLATCRRIAKSRAGTTAAPRGGQESHRTLSIKDGRAIHFVDLEDVICLRTDGNYVKVVTEDKVYFHREPLASLMGRLPPDNFVRISRFGAINTRWLHTLKPLSSTRYRIEMKSGHQLVSSRRYKAHILEALDSGRS